MGARVIEPVRARQVDGFWLALPYGLLVFSSALTWAAGGLTAAEVPWCVAAVLAVAAWHTWWALMHRSWLEAALAPMAVYLAGMVALTAFLLHLSFTFFALYLVCFPLAFVALPGAWAYAGVALTTAVMLLGPGLLTRSGQNVVVTLAGGALAAAAGGSIRALESETSQRRAAMDDLARTQADLERALAQNVALRDRLVAEAREAGVATERSRLAGEIHDTLAAGLAGVLTQLQALDAQLGADHPLSGRVELATAVARETLQEARRSVHALRPGRLGDASLPAGLADLVRGFERTSGLPAALEVSGTVVPLPEAVEDALLRAAQEALTNTGRHAGAGSAHVTLSYLGESVALDVTDDGDGFVVPVPAGDGGGHGLPLMAARAAGVGGHLDVDSAPGRGTTLTVTVPLAAQDSRTP
ncbi:sensor histidine kinase [Georgenia wangjunii]|uniref:sensor histidine kinase n=1 Tax=Georgenia wangjunii TaxID=3117730 RepID=UPI002F26783E